MRQPKGSQLRVKQLRAKAPHTIMAKPSYAFKIKRCQQYFGQSQPMTMTQQDAKGHPGRVGYGSLSLRYPKCLLYERHTPIW